ncbi:MAG: hypothetical protein VKJ04_01445 [Vampirovibrionales bacterium]|nr:hypothetical protein [Vampirovibrionales bacterium]
MSREGLKTPPSSRRSQTATSEEAQGFVSVPKQEYERLLALLAQYEQQYGPLPTPSQAPQTAEVTETSDTEPQEETPDLADTAQDILSLLEQSDETLLEASYEEEIPDILDTSAIRHYGFKRVKHR